MGMNDRTPGSMFDQKSKNPASGQNMSGQSNGSKRVLGGESASRIIQKTVGILDSLAEGIAEMKYAESFKKVVTLQECIDFCMDHKRQYAEVGGFIVSVQKNFDPRNENDRFIIVQGLLDAQGKPISMDGTNTLSQVMHTGTIDREFVRFLDGADKKICMINE